MDASACAPGTKAARPAPGRWLWVPDDDSPAVDGDATASSSGGAVRAPEAEAKPSLEGAAGTSRPPFISRIGVNSVASVREGQVDVEPNQFYCSTGIMVPGGEDSEPCAVRAPEAEAKPSLEGAAGTSRPPFISRIGVNSVASVREGQVDVEPHQFYCSTGIMVPGGEDSEPYMVGTVHDSGAGISCVSEATVCALQKRFPGVDVVQPYDSEAREWAGCAD